MKGRWGMVEDSMHRAPRCQGGGKVVFDKRTAQSKKNFLEKLGRERSLRIYHCPACNGWHITKQQPYGKTRS